MKTIVAVVLFALVSLTQSSPIDKKDETVPSAAIAAPLMGVTSILPRVNVGPVGVTAALPPAYVGPVGATAALPPADVGPVGATAALPPVDVGPVGVTAALPPADVSPVGVTAALPPNISPIVVQNLARQNICTALLCHNVCIALGFRTGSCNIRLECVCRF